MLLLLIIQIHPNRQFRFWNTLLTSTLYFQLFSISATFHFGNGVFTFWHTRVLFVLFYMLVTLLSEDIMLLTFYLLSFVNSTSLIFVLFPYILYLYFIVFIQIFDDCRFSLHIWCRGSGLSITSKDCFFCSRENIWVK